jgi:hypothetical protein
MKRNPTAPRRAWRNGKNSPSGREGKHYVRPTALAIRGRDTAEVWEGVPSMECALAPRFLP